MHFNVNVCSLELDRSIFEEPKNQRVFLDLKVYENIYFIQSRHYILPLGCYLDEVLHLAMPKKDGWGGLAVGFRAMEVVVSR